MVSAMSRATRAVASWSLSQTVVGIFSRAVKTLPVRMGSVRITLQRITREPDLANLLAQQSEPIYWRLPAQGSTAVNASLPHGDGPIRSLNVAGQEQRRAGQ